MGRILSVTSKAGSQKGVPKAGIATEFVRANCNPRGGGENHLKPFKTEALGAMG